MNSNQNKISGNGNISQIQQSQTQNHQNNSAASTSQEANGNDQGSSRQQNNTIGHYVLGKALGEGTFGKVKLGTHILTGEKVAVKVLEKSRIKDKKDVERISREIKILKQLHHPNVVQIYEIIETENDLYLVMEFVQGGELFDLIVQNQKLKEKQACKYFQELISGINYIHQIGICHRDLKPENLLIDYDQSLKIVDFGLSNLYEPGTNLKTACGSPCYAAPEMIAGQKYNGLMSDLWSCGVVLYAMLCGYLPYEDQKTSDLYKKILNAEYTLPDFLSPDAQDIISKIFITDPKNRINIDQIRKHPWYQLQKPETGSFNVCPPSVQASRPDFLFKGGKKMKIVQRPNLLNQKIISNLETQQGFNKESLLKSIKNNKHNHLTATYYLLLKKTMIRHLRPYCDAFMELREWVDNQSEKDLEQINQSHQRTQNHQQPVVQLKSKQVQEAIHQKREIQNNNNEDKQNHEVLQNFSAQNNISIISKAVTNQLGISGQPIATKQFRSIDHNQIIEGKKNQQELQKNGRVQNNNNYTDGYNDYVDTASKQHQLQQTQKMSSIQYKQQLVSADLSSRFSNNSKLSQKQQQNRSSFTDQQLQNDEDQRVYQDNIMKDQEEIMKNQEFISQTHQSFTKKQNINNQQNTTSARNAFNHRREYSANPYIGGDIQANQKYNHLNNPNKEAFSSINNSNQNSKQMLNQNNNLHLKQYQNQLEKFKKIKNDHQNQQQTQTLSQTQPQSQTRNSRWRSNQMNNNIDQSQDNMNSIISQNQQNKYQNAQEKIGNNVGFNGQTPYQNKAQKSQESIKNSQIGNQTQQSEDNYSNKNINVADLAHQLLNPQQTKRRAESYHNNRRGDKSESLDNLEQIKIAVEGDSQRRGGQEQDENVKYYIIQSKNMKQAQKGNQREIRAPSSGSSGSQPRVVVSGGLKGDQGSGAHISVNSSGVQRRYDSIEQHRQSQIDRFLKSPQEQIANLINQKSKQNDPQTSAKYSKKNIAFSGKDSIRKSVNNNNQQVNYTKTGQNLTIQQSNNSNSQQKGKIANNFLQTSQIGKLAIGTGHHIGQMQTTNLQQNQNLDNINIVNILKSKPQQIAGNQMINQTNQNSLSNVLSLAQNTGTAHNNGKPRNSSNGITKNSLEQTDIVKQNQTNKLTDKEQIKMININFQQQQNRAMIQNLMIPQESDNQGQIIDVTKIYENDCDQIYNNKKMQNIQITSNLQQKQNSTQQAQRSSGQNQQQNSQKQNHRKAKSMLNQNGIQNNVAASISMQDGSIRNLIQQLPNHNQNQQQQLHHSQMTPITSTNRAQIAQQNVVPSAPKQGNFLKLKSQVVARNKSSQNNRSSTRNDKVNERNRSRVPVGNQSINSNGNNTNSHNIINQNENSQQLQQQQQIQQIMLQQQLMGKKKILHTTKNQSSTAGAGQLMSQHNFDMIVDGVKDSSVNHLTSVQYNSGVGNARKSHQQVANTIKLSAQSGISLISNFSNGNPLSSSLGGTNNYSTNFSASSTTNKITVNKNILRIDGEGRCSVGGGIINNSSTTNESYLDIIMKEYEKSQNLQNKQNKGYQDSQQLNIQIMQQSKSSEMCKNNNSSSQQYQVCSTQSSTGAPQGLSIEQQVQQKNYNNSQGKPNAQDQQTLEKKQNNYNQQIQQQNVSNKRGTIKVQKINKNQSNQSNSHQHIIQNETDSKKASQQIYNVQKQISQNQKTIQNMTQNLFTQNNAGNYNQQSTQQQKQKNGNEIIINGYDANSTNSNQQQILKVKQQRENGSKNRGTSNSNNNYNSIIQSTKQIVQNNMNSSAVMNNYVMPINVNNSINFNSQNQQTSSSRRYSHQQPAQSSGHSQVQNVQNQIRQSSNQKKSMNNSGNFYQGVTAVAANGQQYFHYQTQDNRNSVSSNGRNGGNGSIQGRTQNQGSNQQIITPGAGTSSQQSYN